MSVMANTGEGKGAKLLSQAHAPVKTLGKEIVNNQPDVEVLAVAFRDVPTTADQFDGMRDKKDFVLLQFGVVDVGPPGFSSAPYKSTKKKNEASAPTKPLYEKRDDSQYPYFFPFEKGQTPKDRGVRVESDDTGVLAAVLQPGVSITHFLYNENDRFAKDKFIVGCDDSTPVIPSNSFVFLQLSCNNIDQARKGRLIKIKKIKPAFSPDTYRRYLFHACNNLPSSAEAAMAVLESSGQRFPSIKEMLGQGSSAGVFAATPQFDTSANVVDDEGGIEMTEYAGAGSRALFVPRHVALPGCNTYTIERASKIMSIAIATQALKVIARPASVQKGPEAPDEAIALFIDFNAMFGFNDVTEMLTKASGETAAKTCRVHDNTLQWFLPGATVETDVGTKQLAFELDLDKRESKAVVKNELPAGVVSDGCAGEYYPLRVLVCESDADFCFPDSLPSGVCTLHLQFRPGATAGCKKRKRVAFEADEESDSDVEH